MCLAAIGRGQDVYYGGFAYSGRAADVEHTYPIAFALDRSDPNQRSSFETRFRTFFEENRSRFKDFNLSFGVAPSGRDAVVLALALTDEKVLCESFADYQKLVVQFGFELLALDFQTREIISSLPLQVELIDASKRPVTPEDIQARARRMLLEPEGQLTAALQGKMALVRTRRRNQGTLRVRNVSIGPNAIPFLPPFLQESPATMAHAVAQQFSSFLALKANVALLPHAKDGVNTKMALRFADASVVQFTIPPPTFAIDLNLQAFARVQARSTDVESLWVYGAYLDVRVYEPAFGDTYWSESLKYGVPKVVPVSQTSVDHYPIFSEALLGVVVTAIDRMRHDRRLADSVLKKCAL